MSKKGLHANKVGKGTTAASESKAKCDEKAGGYETAGKKKGYSTKTSKLLIKRAVVKNRNYTKNNRNDKLERGFGGQTGGQNQVSHQSPQGFQRVAQTAGGMRFLQDLTERLLLWALLCGNTFAQRVFNRL